MKFKLILGFYLFLVAFSMYTVMDSAAPTTINDFFLPGSQPGESGNLENPGKCDNCHGGYDNNVEPAFNWRGSMMSQAARDPLFFAAVAIANQDAPESGDLCLRCHTPKGWLGGRSIPTDGSALTDADREGVTCDYCHKMVKPTPIGVNPFPGDAAYTSNTYGLDQAYLIAIANIPPTSSNGMFVVDDANIRRGPFTDADGNHQEAYSPFHSSSDLCGTCHDVSNPVFSTVRDGSGNIIDYEPNAFDTPSPSFGTHSMLPIERTYSEWKMSAYNSPGGIPSNDFGGNLGNVASCQDCHMMDVTGQGCNKNPPTRTNLPLHDMTGGNTFIPKILSSLFPGEVDTAALNAGIERARYMLQHAATMNMVVDSSIQEVSVTVINETGHKLPSGYPEGRRIWLNVKAWGPDGEIYESGHYDTTTAVLTHDVDAKIYETKPGISPQLGAALSLTPGPSFHFVLNDTIYKDNRIPPRGFTNAKFDSIQSPPIGYSYADGQYWDETEYILPFKPIAVKTRLYYQTTSKEYVEFLRDENITDQSGQTLYDLWEAFGKSTPELMDSAVWGQPIIDVDNDGYILAVDCNDGDPDIYPGAMELKDCLDNDCDGLTDEDFTSEIIHVWTGCNNTEYWNDAGNWNKGTVPQSSDNILIQASKSGSEFPEIYSDVYINSLTIEDGAVLTIEPGATLNLHNSNPAIDAALTIDGTFNNYGSVIIDGEDSKGILINPAGTFVQNGMGTINSYNLYGLENFGVFQVSITGKLDIKDLIGNAVYNHVGSEMVIIGELNIIK